MKFQSGLLSVLLWCRLGEHFGILGNTLKRSSSEFVMVRSKIIIVIYIC